MRLNDDELYSKYLNLPDKDKLMVFSVLYIENKKKKNNRLYEEVNAK